MQRYAANDPGHPNVQNRLTQTAEKHPAGPPRRDEATSLLVL